MMCWPLLPFLYMKYGTSFLVPTFSGNLGLILSFIGQIVLVGGCLGFSMATILYFYWRARALFEKNNDDC
jgi:hypothetical protein